MRLFAIDTDNAITAFPAAEQIPEGQEHFATEKELAKLATNWPTDRLVQIWNGFAGVAGFGGDLKPVKKFTDRKSAVARIWKAIQGLDGAAPETATAAQEAATPAPKVPKGAPKKAKATKTAKAKDAAPEAREGSKKARVIALLQRKNGATLAEIADKMGWKSWTVRGFMAGAMKKAGYTVESFKPEGGERTYRINS
ncbi:MAG: DUF3489 domain-containing protein [Bryobacteraceae bacterium]|jgi:hypothetical protein